MTTTRGKYPTASETEWQAIIQNDASQDGRFFYAVASTGIFCRPSCKSRPPKRENVLVFASAEQAKAARFRPCKRCKPEGQRLPDREWVDQITEFIDRHYRDRLTLETLAEWCHGSPYHLQRTFKRVMRMTPTEYLGRRRIEEAKRALAESQRTVAEIAREVGIGSSAYLITLFKKTTGVTPNEYRKMRTDGRT
ncbi:bifunctional transcriptional activator/DNA repair enzyme AdaA [uncultured Paenibacillus sp.]|uniref:bifunctional transcriptional activator/DNA repair enzyme AdaA n=1 Tax=uncultured Paenibacillus sp. TaxID=227322 RepID=UPI0015AA535E|nr:bifunctional transcriptional activator/DNA repair enzyme AdaA [uncultured Paenibacillus sp.]